MALIVSTSQPPQKRPEQPSGCSPEMIEVATKIVRSLIHYNLIGAQVLDKGTLEQDNIDLLLTSFMDYAQRKARLTKHTIRQHATQLYLFRDALITREILNQYVEFSGYSIIWQDRLMLDISPK